MNNQQLNIKNILITLLITAAISLIVVPLAVNVLFGFSIEWVKAKWDADDALLYVGSILSFIGTMVLGAVSYYQTNVANEMAKNSEHVAKKANELSRISQIIDYEKDRLSSLSDDFRTIRNKVSFQGLVRIEGYKYTIDQYLELNSEIEQVFRNLNNNISHKYKNYLELDSSLKLAKEFFYEYYNYHLDKTNFGVSFPNGRLIEYNTKIYEKLDDLITGYLEFETNEFRKLLFDDISLDEIMHELSNRFSDTN